MSDIQLYNIGTPWSPVIQGQAGKPFSHQPGPKVKGILGNNIIDNSCKCKTEKGTIFYYKFQLTHKDNIPFSKTYSRTQSQSSYKDTMFQEYQSSSGYIWEGKGYVTDIDISRVLISANPFPEYNKSTQRRMRLSLPYNLTLSASNPGFISYPSKNNKGRYILKDKKLWGNYTPYAQQCYPVGVYFQFVLNYQPVKYTTRLVNDYRNGIQTDQELFKGQFHPQQVSDSSVLVTGIINLKKDGSLYSVQKYTVQAGYYPDQVVLIYGISPLGEYFHYSECTYKCKMTRRINKSKLSDANVRDIFLTQAMSLQLPQDDRVPCCMCCKTYRNLVLDRGKVYAQPNYLFNYYLFLPRSFPIPTLLPQYNINEPAFVYKDGEDIETVVQALGIKKEQLSCVPLWHTPIPAVQPCNYPDPIPYTYKIMQNSFGAQSGHIRTKLQKFKIYKQKRVWTAHDSWHLSYLEGWYGAIYLGESTGQISIHAGSPNEDRWPNDSSMNIQVEYQSPVQLVQGGITDIEFLYSDWLKLFIDSGQDTYYTTNDESLNLSKPITITQSVENLSAIYALSSSAYRITQTTYRIVGQSTSDIPSVNTSFFNVRNRKVYYAIASSPYYYSQPAGEGVCTIELASPYTRWVKIRTFQNFFWAQDRWIYPNQIGDTFPPFQLLAKMQEASPGNVVQLYPDLVYITANQPNPTDDNDYLPDVKPQYTFTPVFFYQTVTQDTLGIGNPTIAPRAEWVSETVSETITVSSVQEIMRLGRTADGLYFTTEDKSTWSVSSFTKISENWTIFQENPNDLCIDGYCYRSSRIYRSPQRVAGTYAFKGFVAAQIVSDNSVILIYDKNRQLWKGITCRANYDYASFPPKEK